MTEREYISRFYTLKSNSGEYVAYDQRLKDHLLHVSLLAKSFGEKIGLASLMQLAGLLHDMGKYKNDFQDFIGSESDKSVDLGGKYIRGHSGINHSACGATFIFKKFEDGNACEKFTAELIMRICGYHHGGLKDSIADNGEAKLLVYADESEEMLEAQRRFQAEIEEDTDALFEKASKEVEIILSKLKQSQIPNKGFALSLLVKLAYSMLVDADRLDSMSFELGRDEWKKYIDEKVKEEHLCKYKESLETYIRELGKNKCDNPNRAKVNKIREEISRDCLNRAKEKPGVYNLTVPTGGGKTLASLRFALHHNIANRKGRIIYVIPFTSIIEQTAQVFRNVLGSDSDILEHHSNVIKEDKSEDYDLYTTRFNKDIVITTMVQFLNTFYGRGTQDIRRFHNLLDATIIVDEAQTIPVRCLNLFNSAINFLTQMGNATVVLCTATQPVLDSDENMVPIIKGSTSEIISNVGNLYNSLRRVEVDDCCKKQSYTLAEITDFVMERKMESRSLLVVLNKISSTQNLFREIKARVDESTQLYYLSSNLVPQHKKEVLKNLIEDLEKGRSVICISTAVIEAGIDISFETTIRNLTKLDSIAQTAGRGNRNGENLLGKCYVVNYEEGSYKNLIEVGVGGIRSREILDNYEDVLMPKAIEDYFNGFYGEHEISNKFDFPIRNTNKSIYGLLELNKKNRGGYIGNNYPFVINAYFEEAARYFEVIDKNAESVIVPYGEQGKILVDRIYQINQFTPLADKMKILEDAKKYTVSVFSYNMERLLQLGAIDNKTVPGLNVLSSGYYNDDLGVIYEAEFDDFSC